MFNERTTLQRLLLLKALSGGGQSLVERTALGNPLTFGTDVAKPLKSLLIPFSPKQSGTGDPSPENIRPILPWDGLTVWAGNANIFDITAYNWNNTLSSNFVYTLNNDGSITVNRNDDRSWNAVEFLTGLKKGKYVLQWTGTGTIRARYTVGGQTMQSVNGALPFTIDDTKTGLYIKIFPDSFPGTGNVQIVVGEEPKPYQPYAVTEHETTFTTPCYGGTLDVVSGELWATYYGKTVVWGNGTNETAIGEGYKRRRFYMTRGIRTGSANNKCDKAYYGSSSTAQDAHFYIGVFETGDAYAYIVMPNETPDTDEITVVSAYSSPVLIATLTPQQITALVGDNTMWSDADGQMTAVYLVSKKYDTEHPVSDS